MKLSIGMMVKNEAIWSVACKVLNLFVMQLILNW